MTIHRIHNARRRIAGHLPRYDVARKPLRLSIRDLAGKVIGYLHPTKGFRPGAMSAFFALQRGAQ